MALLFSDYWFFFYWICYESCSYVSDKYVLKVWHHTDRSFRLGPCCFYMSLLFAFSGCGSPPTLPEWWPHQSLSTTPMPWTHTSLVYVFFFSISVLTLWMLKYWNRIKDTRSHWLFFYKTTRDWILVFALVTHIRLSEVCKDLWFLHCPPCDELASLPLPVIARTGPTLGPFCSPAKVVVVWFWNEKLTLLTLS